MPPEKEVIKQQMGQTRSALTEKMELLENQVLGTVRDTTTTVSGTVHELTSTLSTTVHEVGNTVRETTLDVRATLHEAAATVRDSLDISRQMQEHPWLMLGGSVVVGYVGGRLLDSIERGHFPPRALLSSVAEQVLPSDSDLREQIAARPAARVSTPSFLKSLLDTFAPELDQLKKVAIGAAMGLVRDKITESVPPQMRGDVVNLMDRFTARLGAQAPPPGAMYGRDDAEEHNGAERARSMGLG
jgi:hypothetical protein